jgi:hypothetical protein
MKHFTHITTGIVLGLAVMFSGIGSAHALLLGNDVQTSFETPNIGTLLALPGPNPNTQTVGGGVEIPDFGNAGVARVDLSDTMITITALSGGTWLPGTFTGFHFVDINNTISRWEASLNTVLTTMGGLVGSDVTYTDNDIFLNLAGLPITTGQTIVLNVKPVPEPSTMLLFGSGLAGLVAWRARKRHA